MIILVQSSRHAVGTTDFVAPCCEIRSSPIPVPEPTAARSTTSPSRRVGLTVSTCTHACGQFCGQVYNRLVKLCRANTFGPRNTSAVDAGTRRGRRRGDRAWRNPQRA